MADPPQRKFGFPLLMILGFSIGAGVAIAVVFVLGSRSGRFSYTALVDLVLALGGAGTYIGHVVGAARHEEAGFKPFGPITPAVLSVGGGIVLVGTAVVLAAIVGIMTAVKGHPPPH